MLVASHLAPTVTVPTAIAIALGLIWYWLLLGRNDVPATRRRIRRTSLLFMLLSLPMLVRGLSFVDPKLQPRDYVVTWTMAMLMVGLVVITAFVDAMNTMRIHRRLRAKYFEETAEGLADDISKRRRAHRESPGSMNGETRA